MDGCLDQITSVLREEAQMWLTTRDINRIGTKEKISKYEISLERLRYFLSKQDFISFLYTFEKDDITVNGIRECIRKRNDGPDASLRRNLINDRFSFVCKRVVECLDRVVLAAEARNAGLDVDKLKLRLSAEISDAARDK
jgi:hypothetical protein